MESSNKSEAILKFSKEEILISGPLEFVIDQSSKYKELIDSVVMDMISSNKIDASNRKPKFLEHSSTISKIEETDFIDLATPATNYEDVFIMVDEKIQIVCDIPGNSVAKRMINLILIFMWAKLQLGVEEVDFNELRLVCEYYGEFDSSNFARHLNMHKKYFLVTGSGKSQRARLIRPGIKQAETLMEEIIQQK